MMECQCVLGGVAIALVCILIHKYFVKINDYWRKRGVPTVDGAIPFFGNTLSIVLLRKNLSCFCDDIYKANHDRSMVGFFKMLKPMLLIKDPELIKTVLVSSFPNFHGNIVVADPKLDPLLAQNPFFIEGEQWKFRRSRLSNTLMSSAKLKVLCGAVTRVCSKFTAYLEDKVSTSEHGIYEVETKDLFTRYTGEVVASGGFGVEGDFFSNGSGPNSFREIVTGAFEPTLANGIKFSLLFTMPRLSSFLGISIMPKRIDRFFRNVMSSMIALRKKEGTVRHDYLQLMLDNHKVEGGEIDEDAITGSATSFFVDGYETSAVSLGFFAYLVAANPDAQDTLRQEVNTTLDEFNGEITYEALGAMTYMDQALYESMRLYPAMGFLIKRCTEQCKLVGKDDIECVVERGTEIAIPVQALHRDPEYWDNPETFDPDRFNSENKNNRPKTVFLPFGEGPRTCIGIRFATLQLKAAMATILRRFSIEVSPKTKEPLQLIPTSVLTAVEGGLWIKIKPL